MGGVNYLSPVSIKQGVFCLSYCVQSYQSSKSYFKVHLRLTSGGRGSAQGTQSVD